MTLADRQPLDPPAQAADDEPEPERRGWYDPDAASYVALVERVVAIQQRRSSRAPVAGDDPTSPARRP